MNEPRNPYEAPHENAAKGPHAQEYNRFNRVARGCFGGLGMLVGLASLFIAAAVSLDGPPSGAVLVTLFMATLGLFCLFGGTYLLRRAIQPPATDKRTSEEPPVS